MAEPILLAEQLRKTFIAKKGMGPKAVVEAVRGVDLRVGAGEVFGLLGPNGAGKTTTMRMLCTLLPPSGGSGRIAGFDLIRDQAEVRKCIGYVSQKGGMERVATGRENLLLQAQLYGMSRRQAVERVNVILARLKIGEFADRKTNTYSGGQRRIFDLASGIIHSPPLLFLDEPTTGLDPQSRSRVWEEVGRLHGEGATIFLTTHYLEEADALCDRVAIVDRGQVVAHGTPAELKRLVGGDTIALGFASADHAARARNVLLHSVKELVIDERALRLTVEQGDERLPIILAALNAAQLPVLTVALSRPTLDQVFLKLTGRSLTAAEPAEDAA